jgi:hypothetical protein
MVSKKLITATFLLVLTTASLLVMFPPAVKAASGVIAIDPATVTVPSGGNVSLNFANVTFASGQFYLILSADNNVSNPSGTAYSPTFSVAELGNDALVFLYTNSNGTWIIGNRWANGSIPNVAAGSYYIKAFDDTPTSLAVTSSTLTVTAIEDVTPPQTDILLSGTSGENSWYISDVSATLSASDAGGILNTRYSFDDVAWYTYTGPFNIDLEGETTVYYRSTDASLNVESTKTREIKIDKTPPTGTVQINNDEQSTNTNQIALSLTATDTTSGVSQMRFSNDGTNYSPWEAYSPSKSWSLDTELGQKTIYVQFKDEAGLTFTASDSIELTALGTSIPLSYIITPVVIIIAIGVLAAFIKLLTTRRNGGHAERRRKSMPPPPPQVPREPPAEETYEAKSLKEEEKKMAKPPPLPIPQPRYIQAQVYETSAQGEQEIRRINALRANAVHNLYVRIGPEDKEWLTPPLEESTAFPEEKLPRKKDEEILQVVFNEPNHSPKPQMENIKLPRTGPSSFCRFSFHVQNTFKTFLGRIVVLHENRVLQTMLLRSQVVPDPDQAQDCKMDMNIESAIRKNLNDLSSRQKFDLALIANHTEDNQPTLTAVASERATFCSLKNVETIIKDMNNDLETKIIDPKIYPIDIFGKDFTDLIRELSLHGRELYEGIIQDMIGEDKIREARRIQILSKRTDYLPLEFLYDRPPPDMDTPLCPNAKTALKNGNCSECKFNDETPANLICPLGFWFLKMIIERHQIADPDLKEEFGLEFEPISGRDKLQVLRSALFAATSKADESAQGNSQKLFTVIQKATNQKAIRAKTWKEWENAIKTENPSLLVLVTHTKKGGPYNLDQLEIGEDSLKFKTHISKQKHVKASETSKPVLLLLGCDTGISYQDLDRRGITKVNVPFQTFAAKFAREGAVIVVSTLTKILGRHTLPVGEILINELKRAAEEEKSLGDVLLQMRKKCFVEGIPMALTLVANGDADWRFSLTGD